jgi:hypothetical protein
MTPSSPPSGWPQKRGRRHWPFTSLYWTASLRTSGKPQNNARTGFRVTRLESKLYFSNSIRQEPPIISSAGAECCAVRTAPRSPAGRPQK